MTNQEILTKAIQKAIEAENVLDLPVDVSSQIRSVEHDHGVITFWVGGSMYLLSIFNHNFAKALWGDLELTQWLSHDVPAKRSDFRPWDNGFKDWSDVPEYYWYCVNCKMPWRNTFDTRCEKVKHGNVGWEYHLKEMVTSDDPIAYLGEHL